MTIKYIIFLIIILTEKLSSLNISKSQINNEKSPTVFHNKIRTLEYDIYGIDQKITMLKSQLKLYYEKRARFEKIFSTICHSLYYLNEQYDNGLHFTINTKYALETYIGRKTLINFLLNKIKNASLDIANCENEVQNLIQESQNIKTQISHLQSKNSPTHTHARTSPSRLNIMFQKPQSITELLHELEAEEYVGFLKDSIIKIAGKTIVKFSPPCFATQKKIGSKVQFDAQAASKVFAPESGIIIYYGEINGEKIMVIKHNPEYKSIITGIANPFVNIGDYVYKHQIIGELYDSTNNESSLDIQILKNGAEIDSANLFKN